MNKSVFEQPRPDFMRVDDKGFEQEFKPIAQKVEKHLGSLYTQNVFEDGDTLSHQQLCTWVGATAVKLIPDTSMRQWSVSIDDQFELSDILWAKTIWTLVHVLPIGFIVSKHRFGNSGYSWNPALSGLRNSVSATNSNRLFSGFPISQAVLHKLFPEYLDSSHAMLTFALIDTFSSRPNTDNPFYNGIRDAIRMTLIRYPYPIPFFWRDFIESFFSHNSHDLIKFNAAMKQLSPSDSIDINHDIQPLTQTGSLADADESSVKDIDNKASTEIEPESKFIDRSTDAVTSSPDISPDKPIIDVHNTKTPSTRPNISEEQRFHQEILSEHHIQWAKADTPNKEAQYMREIILYWGKIVTEKVQSGKFSINSPSAFAYIVSNNVYITEGGVKRMLSLVNDTQTNWLDWMIHIGLLQRVDGTLITSDTTVSLVTWQLRARVKQYFIPDLEMYSDSDVFSPSTEFAT